MIGSSGKAARTRACTIFNPIVAIVIAAQWIVEYQCGTRRRVSVGIGVRGSGGGISIEGLSCSGGICLSRSGGISDLVSGDSLSGGIVGTSGSDNIAVLVG